MNLVAGEVAVQDAREPGDRAEAVEAVALVRDHEAKDAIVLQHRLAAREECDQVGRVLDQVRGDDPVVVLRMSGELGVALTAPDEIDLLDLVQGDRMPLVLADQLLAAHVVDHVDLVSLALRRDGIVTRADLDAQAVPVDGREDALLSAGDAEVLQLVRRRHGASIAAPHPASPDPAGEGHAREPAMGKPLAKAGPSPGKPGEA
jgi:hypothetical protein